MRKGTVTLDLELYDALMEELNAYRSSVVIETYIYGQDKHTNASVKFLMNRFYMRQVKKQFDELGLRDTHKLEENASTHSEGLYGIISENEEE